MPIATAAPFALGASPHSRRFLIIGPAVPIAHVAEGAAVVSAADGMTIWTGDYLADTQHLTTTQHGAYLLIMMAMWRAGGYLPVDEVRLARIAKLSVDRWRKIRPEVMELLTVEGDRVTQKRLKRELEITLGKIEKRRSAGTAGGNAKALKSQEAILANAREPPEQKDADAAGTRIRTRNREEESLSLRSRVETEIEGRAREPTLGPTPESEAKPTKPLLNVQALFDRFWAAYPKRDGSNPKKPAFERFSKLVTKHGFDPEAIIAGAAVYATERTGEDPRFTAQAITWLNQRRWTDANEMPAEPQLTTQNQIVPRHRGNNDRPQRRSILEGIDALQDAIAQGFTLPPRPA